jgi:hypothetical protein
MAFDLCSGSHELAARAAKALVFLYTREPHRTFTILCRKAHRIFFFDFPRVSAWHATRHHYRVPGAGEAASRFPRQHTLEGM